MNCVHTMNKLDLQAQNKAVKFTNNEIEHIKIREKEIEKMIEEHPNENILKNLWNVNRDCMEAFKNIKKREEIIMENIEIKNKKVEEISKKEVEHMTDLEIINNQISIIRKKIDEQKHFNSIAELVMLSEELRSLVRVRERLERRMF